MGDLTTTVCSSSLGAGGSGAAGSAAGGAVCKEAGLAAPTTGTGTTEGIIISWLAGLLTIRTLLLSSFTSSSEMPVSRTTSINFLISSIVIVIVLGSCSRGF